MAGEGLPFGGSVPDAEPLGVGQLEPPLGQKLARRTGGERVQPFCIKIGCRLVGRQQPAALALLLARDVAALLVPELDAGPGREPLDRLREREVVDLLDELDDVPAVGAREAIPQAAGGGTWWF